MQFAHSELIIVIVTITVIFTVTVTLIVTERLFSAECRIDIVYPLLENGFHFFFIFLSNSFTKSSYQKSDQLTSAINNQRKLSIIDFIQNLNR